MADVAQLAQATSCCQCMPVYAQAPISAQGQPASSNSLVHNGSISGIPVWVYGVIGMLAALVLLTVGGEPCAMHHCETMSSSSSPGVMWWTNASLDNTSIPCMFQKETIAETAECCTWSYVASRPSGKMN